MTIGLSPDLNEAARMATSDMVNFIATQKGLSRDDAYMLASAAMDLIVSEAVDGTKGVHAVIPKSIFHK
jgi:acetamidase/formamidase